MEYSVQPMILRGASTFVKHESSLVSLKNLMIERKNEGKSEQGNELTGIRIFPNPSAWKFNIHSSCLPFGRDEYTDETDL
jgi:hypothetical protein